MDEFINIIRVLLNIKKSFIIFVLEIIMIIENRNTDEARAWIRKYFIEDSDENWLFFILIIGMKDNRLISKPIQVPNQEYEDTVIIVPKNRVDIKISL